MKNQGGQGRLKSLSVYLVFLIYAKGKKNTNFIGDALQCKQVLKIKKMKAVKDYNKKLFNLSCIT